MLERMVRDGHQPVGEHLRLLRFRCFENGRDDLVERLERLAPQARTGVPPKPVSPLLTHVPPVPGTPSAMFPRARRIRRDDELSDDDGDDDDEELDALDDGVAPTDGRAGLSGRPARRRPADLLRDEAEDDDDEEDDEAASAFHDSAGTLQMFLDKEERRATDLRADKGPKMDRPFARKPKSAEVAGEVVDLGGKADRAPGWRSRRGQAEAAAARFERHTLPDSPEEAADSESESESDSEDDDARPAARGRGLVRRGRRLHPSLRPIPRGEASGDPLSS